MGNIITKTESTIRQIGASKPITRSSIANWFLLAWASPYGIVLIAYQPGFAIGQVVINGKGYSLETRSCVTKRGWIRIVKKWVAAKAAERKE